MGVDAIKEKYYRKYPVLDFAEIFAIQSLAKGEANPEQQKKALACILDKICEVDEDTFHLDSERVCSWYQGMRSVGIRIQKTIKIDLHKKREEENVRSSSSGTSGGRTRSKRTSTSGS